MKRKLRSAKQGIRVASKEYVENAMIQADMMRNKPLVPSALEPLRGRLSPHYKRKKKASKRSNDVRDHKARVAIMVARSDINSMLA